MNLFKKSILLEKEEKVEIVGAYTLVILIFYCVYRLNRVLFI